MTKYKVCKKMIKVWLLFVVSSLAIFSSYAENKFFIYRNDSQFNVIPASEIVEITYFTQEDGEEFMAVLLSDDNSTMNIPLANIVKCEVGHDVPTIRITTDEYVYEIQSKEEYLSGKFSMLGCGVYDDVACEVNIRGRGNTTWNMPKKPYRLKFDSKVSLCGLAPAKSYVLIANYLDPSHMKNAVAFKIAEFLGLPYTNHSIPVKVILNDRLCGTYMLSEKIGMGSGSVDLDEDKSILLEMSAEYDEEYQFKTDLYNLPVMVKDPEMTDDLFNKWKLDFNEAVNAIESDEADWTCYFDINTLVDYLLVQNLTANHEVCWPKSTYLYKTDGGKYNFGPVWDFDWGFGYEKSADCPLFIEWEGHLYGTPFFKKLVSDSRFMSLYAKRWQEFKDCYLDQLYSWIDEYAQIIEAAAECDCMLWPQSDSFEIYVESLKKFIQDRVNYIDTNSDTMGLY